jgi:amino acid transporter
VVLLAAPAKRNSTQEVWFKTMNSTGFLPSSFPYVAMLGLLTSTFTLAGYESAAHVAEETKNASRVREPYIVICLIITSIV